MSKSKLREWYLSLVRESGWGFKGRPNADHLARIRSEAAKAAADEARLLASLIDDEGLIPGSSYSRLDASASAEPSLNLLDESGPLMFQPLLDKFSEEVEQDIRTANLSLNTEAFVGEFPTGCFNAQACLTPHGALVLINTGLMNFIYQAVKILYSSSEWREFDDKGDPIQGPPSESVDPVERLATLITSYLQTGTLYWLRNVRRVPAVGGQLGFMYSLLAYSAEKFVIAHEYGHALGGHLRPPFVARVRTPGGEIDLVMKNWEKEFEADLIATHLMLASPTLGQDDQKKQLIMANCLAAGPVLFLCLDDLISRVVKAAGCESIPQSEDHPPSSLRAKALRNRFEVLGGPRMLEFADTCSDWFGAIGDQVVAQARAALVHTK